MGAPDVILGRAGQNLVIIAASGQYFMCDAYNKAINDPIDATSGDAVRASPLGVLKEPLKPFGVSDTKECHTGVF